jgi:hypothetical protein
MVKPINELSTQGLVDVVEKPFDMPARSQFSKTIPDHSTPYPSRPVSMPSKTQTNYSQLPESSRKRAKLVEDHPRGSSTHSDAEFAPDMQHYVVGSEDNEHTSSDKKSRYNLTVLLILNQVTHGIAVVTLISPAPPKSLTRIQVPSEKSRQRMRERGERQKTQPKIGTDLLEEVIWSRMLMEHRRSAKSQAHGFPTLGSKQARLIG